MKLPCSKIAHPGVCLKNTVTLLFLTGKRTWALVSPPPPGVINIMASCSYGKFPGCMSPLPYLLYQPFTLTMRYSLQMRSRMQFSFVAATKQLTCSLNCPLGTDFRQHLTWVPYVRFLSLSLIFFPKVLAIPHMFQYATGGASDNESPCQCGRCRRPKRCGSIPGSGRSPRGGNSNPLQYSCLENSMDRGAWWATVHGVAQSQTRRSGWAHMHRLKHACFWCCCVFSFFFWKPGTQVSVIVTLQI